MMVSRQNNTQSNMKVTRPGSITPSKQGLRRIPHPSESTSGQDNLQFHDGKKHIEIPQR